VSGGGRTLSRALGVGLFALSAAGIG